MFGKAILGRKTRGHPKGRGLRMGAESVTEGMIAGAAILASFSGARFLLTHDAELTATGAETKIDYQNDYDFYLERLFKGSPWAISVMEYFNKEVFNTTAAPSSTPTSTSMSTPRTWEDEFLQELDNPVAHAPSPALSALSTLSVAPGPPSHIPTSSAIMVQNGPIASTATVDVIASCHTTSTSMSISQ
ncbi:hypothetical protein AZE42_13834, partial [Rhizopogon vesiculosus]